MTSKPNDPQVVNLMKEGIPVIIKESADLEKGKALVDPLPDRDLLNRFHTEAIKSKKPKS